MFRPRVIPCLLLRDGGLVKTRKFKDPRYVGDPINAVKLFNEHRADELFFFDIDATLHDRSIPLTLLKEIAEEASMPFAVGGGFRTVEDVRAALSVGCEKVSINTEAARDLDFVRATVDEFGSSSVVGCIDVRRGLLGTRVVVKSGTKRTALDPVEFAKSLVDAGVGEIVTQSVDRDGTMQGYDIDLVRSIATQVPVPVVALGGAGSLEDLRQVVEQGGASAAAAGSMFVFHGARQAVLINFPDSATLDDLFRDVDFESGF